MKIITFFSEKGGVGKTSFAILYASWLKYQNGIDVGVADFNYRIKGIRQRELEHRIRLWEKDNSLPKPNESNAWPLVTTGFKEIAELKEYGFSFPYATWLENKKPVAFAVCEPVWIALLLIVSTAYLAGNSFNPFLYFRF